MDLKSGTAVPSLKLTRIGMTAYLTKLSWWKGY